MCAIKPNKKKNICITVVVVNLFIFTKCRVRNKSAVLIEKRKEVQQQQQNNKKIKTNVTIKTYKV